MAGLNTTGDKRKAAACKAQLFLIAQYQRVDQEGASMWTGGYHQENE
jgi:hypothetical protein